VYHQIILGYIEFVRNLGYERMLIWACPPATSACWSGPARRCRWGAAPLC